MSGVKYGVVNKLSGVVVSYWYNSREYAERVADIYRKRYKGIVLDIVERTGE